VFTGWKWTLGKKMTWVFTGWKWTLGKKMTCKKIIKELNVKNKLLWAVVIEKYYFAWKAS
jgi:hypothetical protein